MKIKFMLAFFGAFMMLYFASCSSKPEVANSEKEQCIATTQDGTRCQLEKENGKDYCVVHLAQDAEVKQCQAKTKKGKQCSRPAERGKNYCWQHSK